METITAYKTTDGQIHECKGTARKNQVAIDLNEDLQTLVEKDPEVLSDDHDMVVDFIKRRKKELLDILNKNYLGNS